MIKKVCVLGAGTMGNGIAHVCSLGGLEVRLCDISEAALEKAMTTIEKNMDRMLAKDRLTAAAKEKALSSISTFTEMADAVKACDLVIEAVSERMELKSQIFKTLDEICPKKTILASNTSSISITQLAAHTGRPDKVIGMHFFNPVAVMKLVEVIRGYGTSNKVTKDILSLSKSLGKVPVEVNDYPGFVSNRVLMPMINEAIICLHEGVAGVTEIDTVMKLGMAHPMGPLYLADFIGLDVCLSIMRVLQDGLGNPKYAPCPLLVNMVSAGKLGRKSGEGFYVHERGSKEIKVSKSFA